MCYTYVKRDPCTSKETYLHRSKSTTTSLHMWKQTLFSLWSIARSCDIWASHVTDEWVVYHVTYEGVGHGWISNLSRHVWRSDGVYQGVMSRMNESFVTSRMNESCHVWISHLSRHVWRSDGVYQGVMSRINQIFITSHMKELWRVWRNHVAYEWDVCHVTYEGAMTCMKELCHKWKSHVSGEWVMSRIMSRMNTSCHKRISQMSETCHKRALLNELVMSRINTSGHKRISRMNESCH